MSLLLLIFSRAQAQSPEDSTLRTEALFNIRAYSIFTRLESNAAKWTATIHHHHDATNMLMNFLSIRGGNINSPGYQNSVEQSKIPVRDIEEALAKIEGFKLERSQLKEELEIFLAAPGGPFNAVQIRAKITELVSLQDDLINATKAHQNKVAAIHSPMAKVSGVLPPHPSAVREMHQLADLVRDTKAKIAVARQKLLDLQGEERPLSLGEKIGTCWTNLMAPIAAKFGR